MKLQLTIVLGVVALLSGCSQPVAAPPTVSPSVVASSPGLSVSPSPSPAVTPSATTLKPVQPKPDAEVATNQPSQRATLTSENPKSRINVRQEPSRNATAQHYGFAGDAVEILESTRSKDDDGLWYRVRFVSSGAIGWVSAAYVNVAAASSPTTKPAPAKSGVLTAQNAESRINVRQEPSRNATAQHYGFAGDRVEILAETRSKDDDGLWYQVKFVKSGAIGWVSASYVSVQ